MFSQEWKDHYETKKLIETLSEELELIKDSWANDAWPTEKESNVWLGRAQAVRLVLDKISMGGD